MKLSVVVSVFNEEENVIPLFEQINTALKDYEYEAIFVDDGSTDKTREMVKSIENSSVHLIELRKNYGQSSALSAGIQYASGDYVITIDGDLQNDPSDIPMMVNKAEEGDWDLVAGVRANRKDDFVLRKIPSKIANRIIRRSTGVEMKDNGCALKVFKSSVVKNLGLYGELHRFIAVLAALEGATITQVNVKHHARIHGKSKYGLSRTFKVVSDLWLILFFKKYMQRPMHFFGLWGGVIATIGVLINVYLFILKVLGHDIWGKPLILLGILAFLFGFQIITIGIIAEVQMRTYFESQNKRPYLVRNIFVGGQKKN